MSKKVIFISYYTKKTPYEEVMNTHLMPTLKNFNLDYDIEGIEDLGNWANNTGYKSRFIVKMLEKHKCPVVFLDADATIEKFPKFLLNISSEYDICFHYLDWNLQWRGHIGDKKEFLSGTMWFNYNPKVVNLVKEFIKEIEQNIATWEQKTMQRVVESHNDLKILQLPKEYIVIPRQNGKIPPHIKKEDIIILHHQASRKYKNK